MRHLSYNFVNFESPTYQLIVDQPDAALYTYQNICRLINEHSIQYPLPPVVFYFLFGCRIHLDTVRTTLPINK